MYNTDMPTRAELPTSAQLIRSTVIAIVTAAVILVTIVLPAEYNIDPTGVGRFLGLAEMGAIKKQLSEEAERDRQLKQKKQNSSHNFRSIGSVIAGLFITPAKADDKVWKDTRSVTLTPGQGAEIKLVMEKGAKAVFEWSVQGGKVNCDLHGDNDTESVRYLKTRGSKGRKGELIAKFKGNHGWFWRNRGKEPVTVTIKVNGEYSEIKRVL